MGSELEQPLCGLRRWRRSPAVHSVDGGQEMFGGVLMSAGPEKAFGGFWRGVVELTTLDAAEVARVADAVTDIDRGRLERDVAELADRLPTVGTIKGHLPTPQLKSGTPASD